jgi:Domain of unknown function (DUF4160)
MAKLKCISISGIQLWFYSHDHEPPHFHAKRRGEWEYKVNFLQAVDEMLVLVWSEKKMQMSKADRERLQELVEENRFEILREWEQKVNRHAN